MPIDLVNFIFFFLVQGRLLRTDLIQYWKVMDGHCSIPVDSIFTQP